MAHVLAKNDPEAEVIVFLHMTTAAVSRPSA